MEGRNEGTIGNSRLRPENGQAVPPRQGFIARMFAALGVRPKARAVHHYEDITSLSNAEPALRRASSGWILSQSTMGKLPKGR